MEQLLEEIYSETHHNFIRKFQESEYLYYQLSDVEKEALYNEFKDTYIKETGFAFDTYKFRSVASSWKFYGDKPNEDNTDAIIGGVAIREQPGGLCKLNACFGPFRSIIRGFTELMDDHGSDPIWGLVTPKIRGLICRGCKDFVKLPEPVVKIMEPMLKKVSHGAVQSVALNGECTTLVPGGNGTTMIKVYVCNKNYVKWLLNSINNGTSPIPKVLIEPFIKQLEILAQD